MTRYLLAAVLAVAILAAGWILRREAPPEPPSPPAVQATIAAPPPASAPEAPAVLPDDAWVVWYGEDARVYRRSSSPGYQELYSALHRSLEDDRVGLDALTRGYLTVELEPALTELRLQLGPWLDDIFGLGAGASRLGLAMDAAARAIDQAPPEETEDELLEQVRISLAESLVQRFQAEVFGAGTTRRALRAAAERAFALLRNDLLQNCDRYDRAFRWFVLNTPGTVESLEGETDWRPDPFWQPSTATFLSLCQGLRRAPAGVGPVAEAALTESFVALEAEVHARALERMDTPAQAALQVNLERIDYIASLEQLGLEPDWAQPPALLAAYLASPWTLGQAAWDGLGDSVQRTALETRLGAALDGLGETLRQRLHQAGRDYLEAELERMSLGLAARSEGAWSAAP